jgi:excisionase family DNA binding protein
MTIQQAAAEFGLGVGTLYAWVRTGRIASHTTSDGLVLIGRGVVRRVLDHERPGDDGLSAVRTHDGPTVAGSRRSHAG